MVTLAAGIDAKAMQAHARQHGAIFWNFRLFLEKTRCARVAGRSERRDGHVGHEQSGDTAGCRVQRRHGAAGAWAAQREVPRWVGRQVQR